MIEKHHNIISSNRSRPIRLLAIWLFLIVLPALAMIVAFDLILSDSEKYLCDKLKIRMMQELNDFRGKLSFSNMMELKMRAFTCRKSLDFADAQQLAEAINTDLKIPACIVFLLNPQNSDFSSHIADSVKSATGMISRTMLRNYLQYLPEINSKNENYSSTDRENASTSTSSEAAFSRSLSYLRGLFAAAGKISLQFDKAVPVISGKPAFGRLIFFAMPLAASKNAVVVFRECDIKPDQLIDFALNNNLFADLKRSVCYLKEGMSSVYRLSEEMQSFLAGDNGGIILKGMASEEYLLRLATEGTFYPSNLDRTLDNLPLLQITATADLLRHPLRKFHAKARAVSLILVLFASITLLHIFLFGYGKTFRIRSRLFVCVFGASILPFSTFMTGVIYHEHFSEEFEKAEIAQYMQMRMDFINKSFNAKIEAEELKLAELSETLGRLGLPQTLAYLTKWQKESAATLVLHSQDGNENIFTSDPGAKLGPTEIGMKDITFMSLKDSLAPVEQMQETPDSNLGAVGFKIKGLGIVLENVGRLHDSLSDNISTVFSSFPVYFENQRFNSPKAMMLAKYYTTDILKAFLNEHPETIRPEIRGNYRIKNCIIPIIQPSRLPDKSQVFSDAELSLADLEPLARKTLRTKSLTTWNDGKTQAIAGYHNRLHCIIIQVANRIENNHSVARTVILPGAIYFLLMVITMVIFMSKMLMEPIELLKTGAGLVAEGNYQHCIEFPSGDEFEPLTSSFNHMTAGLHQRDLLASYVSQDVLEEVSIDKTLVPGGERVEASVLFCALKGFKDFNQTASPEKIVAALGLLIEVADQAAINHGGVMDKLIEDTVMLVFRQRNSENDHAISACKAAIEIRRAFPIAAVPFKVVTGIASGPAVSGKIGSKTGKLDFTLIGNPVNLAARLKAQAHKAENTGIIACPATIRLIKGQARLRFIERTEIKGRSRTFPLYELMELR
ncbi:MAG: HAMP domain-containing protein [Candidatus Riflebacteria bacterium]|nr:HAMP domain-containing protein [Candidatus Riflebacteria bacterium]